MVRGPLQVTIDEDGETRAHDRFTLAAPIAGRLSRIEFHEGDEVGPETVLATISPLPLDAREVAEIRARIQSAEARKREAEEQLARWESDHAQASRDLNRARQLAKERMIAQQELEQAESKQASAAKKWKPRSSACNPPRPTSSAKRPAWFRSKRSRVSRASGRRSARPSRCRILRILEKSERVVPFGTPIVVLSNPQQDRNRRGPAFNGRSESEARRAGHHRELGRRQRPCAPRCEPSSLMASPKSPRSESKSNEPM